jgi:hypothetical protein
MKSREGFGAFLYPPAIIRDEGSRHHDELIPTIEPMKRLIVCNHQVKGDFRVLISEDGFIGLLTEDDKKTVDYLNVLFSTLITKFHSAKYITMHDLVSFSWDGKDFIKFKMKNPFSLRTIFELQRDNKGTFSDWKLVPRNEIGIYFITRMSDFQP